MANDKNFKVKNGLDVGGSVTLTGSSALIFDTNQQGLGGELGLRGSGEAFQIFEPEDANKVWLQINDDPAGSNTAFQINSTAGMSPVFHDQYHPNADKWTTARTITLTGDVTGSTSIDGSANVSITTTVANDSHSHSNYLIKTGDTATGTITFNGQVNLNQWVYMNVAGQNFVLNSDTANRNTLEWQQNSTRVWTLDLQADGDLNFVPSSGDVVRISDNRIFDDGYHPNADKWTTARTNTVTLTGAVTGSGSASVDGSGNWTVSVPTTVNHTHNYDNYVSWTAKDHDGTTYTVTSGDTLWFKEGSAIDVNFTADDELTISHADTSSQSSVNNSNGVVIQDVTLDGHGHVTGLASVDLDGRYALISHKYHSFSNGQYFHDNYEQGNNFRLFTENYKSDNIRHGAISNVEYYNGSAWVAWSGGDSAIQNILDGNENSGTNIDHTHRQFRFVVQASTGYPTGALFFLQTTWTAISYPGITVTIEDSTSATGTFTQRDSAVFTSANTGNNWGIHAKYMSTLHNGASFYRFTVDITDWTDYNSNYTTIPLRRIALLSNYSGDNIDPYSVAYDKRMNLEGGLTANGSIHSPIFYDKDNTGYYIDANNESNISRLIVNGGDDNGNKADLSVGCGGNPQISLYANSVNMGGTDMNWSSKFYYASGTFLGAWDNQITVFVQGGTTDRNIVFQPSLAGTSTTRLTVTPNAGVQASQDMRAPVFYDLDNTAYFVNPTNTSNINILNVADINRDPTVTLSGDVTGSATMTNLGSINITTTVANDSHTHSNYVLKAGDTMTGALTISSTVQNLLNIYNNTNAGGATINFSDNSGQGQTGQITFYHSDAQSPGSAYGASFKFNTDQPNLAVILDETGDYFVGTNKVFHDGYHPNADKWTTARTNTVTLTGSVTGTGSASVDGSGNWTVTVPTTTNHTHNYDNYVSWTAEDGDGTQYTVTSGDVLKFAEGSGINVNFSADDVLRIEYKGNEIPGSVDLNTYRTTGFYAQNANADAASGSNYPTANAGILQVINDDYGNGLHTTQLYSQYNSTNYYHRTYYNGTWSSWRNLAQDTTYTVGNGSMTVSTGGGLTGGGQLGTANQTGNTSITVSHADTSSQASVNNSNGTVIQDITLDTYGHITAIGSVNLDGRYQLIAAPAAPSITSTTLSGETVEIVFSQSATSGVNGYEIWSDGGGVSFALIGRIPAQDIAASMSFVDTTFTDTGTINYRVYAIRNGVYSSAATTSATFSVPSLDVANFAAIPDLNAFHLQYDLPVTRFLDHIEIYLDTNAASGSLARANATLIYSGDNPSYTHNISASDRDNYHQFWVECVGVA